MRYTLRQKCLANKHGGEKGISWSGGKNFYL